MTTELLQQSNYLKTIRKEPVDHLPMWIMRQAGRYLPEYRALREKYDFLTVCKTAELAAEVTVQPIRRFDFDAAILFSDILVVPEAMGQRLRFAKNHGPLLVPAVQRAEDLQRFSAEGVVEKLDYVAQAIRACRNELPAHTPLIGFSGSPWTLAVYMIEGKGTRTFSKCKGMMYSQPEVMEQLLDLLTDAVSSYLRMQVEAGVQALQIFDTWGGILPEPVFARWSGRYMQKILHNLQDLQVPVTLFTRGGRGILGELQSYSPDVLGVDWTLDIKNLSPHVSEDQVLQGNLDPTILYGSHEEIAKAVDRLLEFACQRPGHVFNLGHGILPDIDPDKVGFLRDLVRERSAKLLER